MAATTQNAINNVPISATANGNTTQNTSASFDLRSVSISGAGAASVGFSASNIVVSVPTQTVQTEGWTAVGNTTGSTSSTTFNSNFSISGSGGASVGFSGQTIQIAAPATSALSSSAVGNTTGSTSSTTFQNIESISGAGAVSVGFSGQTMIISGATAGATQSISAVGLTTGSTSSTSVGTGYSISGTGGVSVGFSGQTLIISGPGAGGGATLSKTYFPNGLEGSVFQGAAAGWASNSYWIQYCPIPQNISISRGALLISFTPQTSAAASTGSWSATIGMGLYTRNGTTLSSFLSSSGTISCSWSSNSSLSVNGIRFITCPLATLLTPNEYWCMVNLSTATGANLSASQSIVYLQGVYNVAIGAFGVTQGGAVYPGLVNNTTSSYTLPASLGINTAVPPANGANFFLQLDNYAVT